MNTIKKYTPAGIKQLYQTNPDAGHFFDRNTIKFFGDTMHSYAVTAMGDAQYMYRKRTASVNVFGKTKTVGRDYFGCWKVVEEGGRLDLDSCSKETTDTVFNHLYS